MPQVRGVDSVMGCGRNIFLRVDLVLHLQILDWFTNRDPKAYRIIPMVVIWGIWTARNSVLFEEK